MAARMPLCPLASSSTTAAGSSAKLLMTPNWPDDPVKTIRVWSPSVPSLCQLIPLIVPDTAWMSVRVTDPLAGRRQRLSAHGASRRALGRAGVPALVLRTNRPVQASRNRHPGPEAKSLAA